jgi:uncharacterized protein (DUF2384 family)
MKAATTKRKAGFEKPISDRDFFEVYEALATIWDMNDLTRAQLLTVESADLQGWRCGELLRLREAQRRRVSRIVNIHLSLVGILGSPKKAALWVNTPRVDLSGRSPLSCMLAERAGIARIERYLRPLL